MNSLNNSEQESIIRLPGGRRLGYYEFGRSAGRPLLYCHGFPGSGLEAGLAHDCCKQHGFRLIAPDRPGYGLSDPLPQPSLRQWSHDVAELTDHLSIDNYDLMGVSGGAPAALAVTALQPTKIASCTLVCPLAPLADQDLQAMLAMPSRLGLKILSSSALLRNLIAKPVISWLARKPQRAMDLFVKQAARVDKQVIAQPEISAILHDSLNQALQQQGLGCLQDIDNYCTPWPFSLAAIESIIHLWHGLADNIVSPANSRFYQANIPSSQAHYLPGQGHFSLPLSQMDSILRAISPASR